MTDAWRSPPEGPAAAIAAAVAAAVPVMDTARLRLRAPRMEDFTAYEAVFTSDRARLIGGGFDAEGAYGDFCQAVAGWMLRGAGMWTITARDDAATPLGWVYLWAEYGDREPELGWVLTPEAEGRGYAREAAEAVLPHAEALYGRGGVVSYIDACNDRSIRLAERLGARRDPAAEDPGGELLVYRHHAGEPR